MVKRASALLLLAVAGVAQGQGVYPGNEVKISAGLESIRDWSRSHLTTDIVKQGRPWGSPTDPWEGSQNIVLDANGWPAQDAGMTMICCQVPGQGIEGTYRISFECATMPEIRPIASNGTVINAVRDPVTGVVTADYVFPSYASDGQLMLGFFGTNGGVRNLRVIRPDANPAENFDPLYKNHISRFKMLRWMDMNLVNNSTTQFWSQRTQPTEVTWRAKTGVPYEVAIALSNELNVDYYVCIPHRADDNYIRQLARLIRDNLNPNLKVYVEYSNEVWNTIYRAGSETRDNAINEVNNDPTSNLAYDGTTNTNHWRWRLYARRSKEMAEIFKQEFGPNSLNARVRPILAGQAVRDEQYNNMLRFIEDNYGAPNQFFHALGIAPYFWAWHLNNVETVTVDDFIRELRQGTGTAQGSIEWWRNNIVLERYASFSTWYGLAPVVAYEAGPDTRGFQHTTVKRATYYDPRMRTLCNDYIDMWHSKGGGALIWAIAGAGNWLSDSGAYPILENMLEPVTTRTQSIDDKRSAPRAALDAGTLVPGTVDCRKHIMRSTNWQSQQTPPALLTGQFYDYLVRVDTGGSYPLSVIASNWETDTSVTLLVNGQSMGTQTIGVTGGNGNTNYQTFGSVNVTLPAGLSTVRVRSNRAGGYLLKELVIATNTPACDSIDFNNDGSIFDPQDIAAFLSVYSEGPCIPSTATCNDIDFNNDGSVFDPEDINAFIRVYGEGPCQL